ncbi:MAG TPA: hypothetical protein VN980_12845, partial [Alphaproteobacteria bacterium]|nr:hypothetical protein [Alphaproteobacteria bacterium]
MWRIAWSVLVAVLVLAKAEAQQPAEPQPGWIADANGCRVWNADPVPGQSISWSGPCNDGLADGKGVLQWSENGRPSDRYEGEFVKGHANGHAVFTWENGDRFEGEFKNDHRNGHGVVRFVSGDRFEG